MPKKQASAWEESVSIRIILAIISMSIALYLCTETRIFFWIAGQIVFAFATMQAYLLLERFAYGKEIKSKLINSIGGHIASFFCMVPFNQWRVLNIPGEVLAVPIEKKFIPPLNVLIFSWKNHWNIIKLFRRFTDKPTRIQFVLSMLVMNCLFLLVMPNVPHFWRKFGVGYFLFLLLAERKLIKRKKLVTIQSS